MRNKEKLYSISTCCLVFIFLISISSPASATEITVDDNKEADFLSIQEAVDNSSPGDVVLVSPGTYNENVNIEIQNISVLSESGNPEDTFIRAFNVSTNNITVSGFSIEEVLNLGGYSGYYYYNYPVENCTVKNNVLKSGIHSNECCNSTIEKNVVLNSGIYIQYSDGSNVTISDNLIVKGKIDVYQGPRNCILLNNTLLNGSIGLTECGNHKILGNYISNSPYSGISLWESYSNEIENNTVVNCSNGISMEFLSSQNIINNNTLTTCSDKGIWIKGSGGENSLLNNTISNNDIGIWVGEDSSSNLVANNNVELNKKCGVYLNGIAYTRPFNRTNRFYNNIFNNTVNVFNDTNSYYTAESIGHGARIFPVAWNTTTKTPDTNIVGGPYIGGNYWAKPDGTGFSQICADSNGDGIGDLPYNINENETDFDYLPLVPVSKSQKTILPVANFSTNITENLAPLTVQFTDLSKNAVAWSWDFDNDGMKDSTKQNPVTTYSNPGNYTVNLTVSNGKDKDSKTASITVLQESSSSSFSGNSGSSGNSHSNSGKLRIVSNEGSNNIVNESTDKKTEIGTAIKTGNSTESIEQKNGTQAASVEQTPEQRLSSNTSENKSTKAPCFEIVSGVLCLLGVFLYRRR